MRLVYWLLPTALAIYGCCLGWKGHRTWDPGKKWIWIYLLVAALNTLAMEWMGFAWRSNAVLIQVFLPFQILLFSAAYAAWSQGPLRAFFQVAGLGYLAVWCVLFPRQNHAAFGNGFILAEVGLFLLLGVVMLVSQSLRPFPIVRTPAFWVGTGAVMDGSFTLLFFLGIDWAMASARGWVVGMMLFRAVLVSLTYVMYARALRCPPPTDCS